MSFSNINNNNSVDLQFDLDEALACSSTTTATKPPPSPPSSSSLSSSSSSSSDNRVVYVMELPMVSVEVDSVCCVCMEGFQYPHNSQGVAKQLPCRHVYHPDCILSWMSSCHHSCPLCRQVIHFHDHHEQPTQQAAT